LDSIPGVCGPNSPISTLKGSPPGGEFAGVGVTENEFSPTLAGVGDHSVTYTVKAAPECAGTVASRMAVVAPIPTIQLTDSMTTYKGNTFTMNPVYTGNPNQFQWASSTNLDNPSLANPTVMDIANDITYTINVKNNTGCEARDTIRITVYAGVWVPDAFSPNGDGLNDVWDLPGIEAFPDAIVTIFNRWGEVIYSSGKGYTNPFDGTLNGVSLPGGVYAYIVRTAPARPVLRGKLMLVR
ncbi:gliding motility-associated C-terminal domain-containing protein, partial [Spirosoma sp.]|uniref:gliding motility-associated C-terminal domain-containing protein n=1 Tax=Spirosoma sp. TaxID=1899569 RepID=UPI003B3A7188